MATPNDPLGWNEIARYAQASGDPQYAAWVDPNDPLGFNQAARAAQKAGDPNFANWVDPLGVVTPFQPAGSVDNSPNTTGVAPVTTTPAAAKPDTSMFDLVTTTLDEMGLSNLWSVDASGKPGGWLWDQIANGNTTASGLGMAIEQTQEFKSRYPIIATMRAQGSPYVPTPKNVRDFENAVGASFRHAGLPPSMYSDPLYLQSLMDDYGGDNATSASEIAERVGTAYERVATVSPQIREAFEQFYGVGAGDGALAAFFLDPTKTMADLNQKSMAGYTAGMGKQLGVNIDQVTAERLAQLPKTEAGITQDLTTVAGLGNVLTEGITEVDDLNQQTGIEATSFGNADAQRALERRVLERQANERSSFGGGLVTNEGLTGVGSR